MADAYIPLVPYAIDREGDNEAAAAAPELPPLPPIQEELTLEKCQEMIRNLNDEKAMYSRKQSEVDKMIRDLERKKEKLLRLKDAEEHIARLRASINGEMPDEVRREPSLPPAEEIDRRYFYYSADVLRQIPRPVFIGAREIDTTRFSFTASRKMRLKEIDGTLWGVDRDTDEPFGVAYTIDSPKSSKFFWKFLVEYIERYNRSIYLRVIDKIKKVPQDVDVHRLTVFPSDNSEHFYDYCWVNYQRSKSSGRAPKRARHSK
jgi:hypothetical protein